MKKSTKSCIDGTPHILLVTEFTSSKVEWIKEACENEGCKFTKTFPRPQFDSITGALIKLKTDVSI